MPDASQSDGLYIQLRSRQVFYRLKNIQIASFLRDACTREVAAFADPTYKSEEDDPLKFPNPTSGALAKHVAAMDQLLRDIRDGGPFIVSGPEGMRLNSSSAAPSQPSNPCKKRKNEHAHKRQAVKNKRQKMDQVGVGLPDPRIIQKVQDAQQPIQTQFSLKRDAKSAKGGFVGKNHSKAERADYQRPITLQEFVERKKFQKIIWDGDVPRPVVDADGLLVLCLIGKPIEDTATGTEHPEHPEHPEAMEDVATTEASPPEPFDESMAKLYHHMLYCGEHLDFSHDSLEHRRGPYPTVECGVSMGGGQTHPMEFSSGLLGKGKHAEDVRRMLLQPYVRRLYRFIITSIRTYAPRLAKFYVEKMKEMCRLCKVKCRDDIRGIFPDEPPFFCCASPNIPAQQATHLRRYRGESSVRTYAHRDVRNFAPGWCSITALGNFNHKTGGHLVLWDLKLVIEFPPGATILIPSALLLHSNVPVQDGESRCSITFYTPGGLFRWTDNGGFTDTELAVSDPERLEEIMRRRETLWQEGLKLYSTFTELFDSGRGDEVLDLDSDV